MESPFFFDRAHRAADGEREPHDGDVSICLHCSAVLVFRFRDGVNEHNLTLAVASREDIRRLQESSPEGFAMLLEAQRVVPKIVALRRGKCRTPFHKM